MKPLIPQTVYVESSERILANYWARRIDAVEEQKYLEKKENQYIFTKEELIELFNMCLNYGVELEEKYYSHEEHREQFINNLLNQQ